MKLENIGKNFKNFEFHEFDWWTKMHYQCFFSFFLLCSLTGSTKCRNHSKLISQVYPSYRARVCLYKSSRCQWNMMRKISIMRAWFPEIHAQLRYTKRRSVVNIKIKCTHKTCNDYLSLSLCLCVFTYFVVHVVHAGCRLLFELYPLADWLAGWLITLN